jgi:Sensors of blue-light using FAD
VVSSFHSTAPDTLPGGDETKMDKPRLHQMLVCSLVVGKPTTDQLQALYDLSVRNNRNRGLTGVLLCGNGVFVHWLEGLEDYLQEAWATIAKDNRHEDIVILWQHHDAPERLFGDWVMGLRSTLVAQDLLGIMHVVKQQQSAKDMLRVGYYEVFTESFALLERVCAQKPMDMEGTSPGRRKLVGPALSVIAKMVTTPFQPKLVVQQLAPAQKASFNELSSLNTDASSMFRNSVPAEHTALFDMAAEGSDDLLTMLDMPMRCALGRDLWARRQNLSDKPLHWTYDGKLVVVVDHKTWRVGMHPELTYVAYEQATMAEKLSSANDIPSQFRQTTAYALFWDYAQSPDSRDLKLPSRFAKQPIQLRRRPPVPEPTLDPQQLRVLAILGKGKERMQDLAQALGISVGDMAQLLRPFYAARCIEVVPQK